MFYFKIHGGIEEADIIQQRGNLMQEMASQLYFQRGIILKVFSGSEYHSSLLTEAHCFLTGFY